MSERKDFNYGETGYSDDRVILEPGDEAVRLEGQFRFAIGPTELRLLLEGKRLALSIDHEYVAILNYSEDAPVPPAAETD